MILVKEARVEKNSIKHYETLLNPILTLYLIDGRFFVRHIPSLSSISTMPGVSSHLSNTMGKRNTSVGTPYWMAPVSTVYSLKDDKDKTHTHEQRLRSRQLLLQ